MTNRPNKTALDAFDLEAEQEGQALQKMNQNKIKKPRGQKPNARTVDVRVLEETFDIVYGNAGYVAAERSKNDDD